MRTSQQGIEAIKALEGFRNHMYLDSAGLPTIGVGHLLTKSELTSGKVNTGDRIVEWADGLDQGAIDGLLRRDLLQAESAVPSHWEIYQHRFDALVCFAFNVGTQAARGSTLWKLVGAERFDEVPAQFRRWIHSGGRVVQGLVNRREAEVRMWNGEYPS